MNRKSAALFLVVTLICLVIPVICLAVPNVMSYQGKLNDRAGNPINGSKSIIFTIYDAATGGTALWSEMQNVVVTNGILNVELGSVATIPNTLFNSDNRFLGIKFANDSEMTPRQRIASGAYAFKAKMYESSDRLTNYLGLSNLRNMQLGIIDLGGGQTDGWGEVYVDSDGRGNSVVSSNTASAFNINKYTANKFSILIEAAGIKPADFFINNCLCINIAPGKWILTSSRSSKELQKADVMQTLFYGTNGTDGRAKNAFYQGLTAVRVSDPILVGYRGIYVNHSTTVPESAGLYTYTGIFSNVTNNLNCQAWTSGGTSNVSNFSASVVLGGITVGSCGPGASWSDIGADTHTKIVSNPSSITFNLYDNSSNAYWGSATWEIGYFITNGTVNFSGGASNSINKDYTTSENFPLFSVMNDEFNVSVISHNISSNTFSSTISKAIGIPLIADWEDGADIQYKLSNATEDTGWLPAGNNPKTTTFTPFTSQPTTLTVKLIPKATNPTPGYPSIKGFWVYAE